MSEDIGYIRDQKRIFQGKVSEGIATSTDKKQLARFLILENQFMAKRNTNQEYQQKGYYQNYKPGIYKVGRETWIVTGKEPEHVLKNKLNNIISRSGGSLPNPVRENLTRENMEWAVRQQRHPGSGVNVTQKQTQQSQQSQPDTLADVVRQEQKRLAVKYPGYTPTAASTRNIARNLIEYGVPISPSNRAYSGVNTYPDYTGPSPGQILAKVRTEIDGKEPGFSKGIPISEVPLDMLVKVKGDPNVYVRGDWLKSQKGAVIGGGGILPKGTQKAYTQASARIDPVTGERVIFGGGMVGENVPDKILRKVGLETLFNRRAVRGVEKQTGRSLERDFSGFKDASEKMGIEKVMEFKEGSILNVVETSPEPLTREQEAKQWKDLGVYDRQDLYDAQRKVQETNLVGDVVLKSSLVDIGSANLKRADMNIGGVAIVPLGLDTKIDFGQVKTVESYAPDMSYLGDVDKIVENFGGIPGTGLKIPFFYDYIEKPLYQYAASEYKAIEYEKQSGLLAAKSDLERKQVLSRYGERYKGISDPLNVKVSLEGMKGRYSNNPDFNLRAFEEIAGRFNEVDLPIVDIKLSPGAAAVVTGGMVGVSFGVPVGAAAAATGGGATAILLAGGTGLAQITTAYTVSSEVRKATGSAGLGVISGALSAGVVNYASQAVKTRFAPFNRGEIIANTQKVTESYTIGHQKIGTTLNKDIYVGSGKNVPFTELRGAYKVGLGAGKGAGKELPVFVRLSNRLGETKLISTTSGKAYITSSELGLGGSIAAKSYLRDVAPGLKQATPFKEGFVNVGDGLLISKGVGYKLPGQMLGVRRPVFNQRVISSYWVGSGKDSISFSTAFKGQVKMKHVLKIDDTSIDLFTMKGKGFVSRWGSRPSNVIDVRMSGVKSTVLKDNIAYGSEFVVGKVGKSIVSKYVPKYSELFKKSHISGGGSGAGSVKIVGGGSGGSQVIDMKFVDDVFLADIPKSLIKSTGSRSSNAKVILESKSFESFGASMMGSASRQAVAQAYVVSQPVQLSGSLSIPLMISEPDFSSANYEMSNINLGLAQVSSSQLDQKYSSGLLVMPKRGQQVTQLDKQFLITEQLQKQAQPNLLSRKNKFLNKIQKHSQNEQVLKQSYGVNVVEKQVQDPVINRQFKINENILIQGSKQRLEGILGKQQIIETGFKWHEGKIPPGDPRIPGLGIPGAWFPGGGSGKSQRVVGNRFTIKNPWLDAEAFADRILGSGKKKRRRKKK